jgi:hypothetical protein
MLVLLLAIAAIVLFGLGFVVKWLFIAAIVALVLAIVAGVGGRSRMRA